MRQLIFAVSIFCASTADAAFFTYSEWDRLSEDGRAMYIAGAYDSLTGYASDDRGASTARHYQQCVARAKMSNAQLAANIRVFAASRPSMQSSTVQNALVNYLIEACGKAP